MEFEKHSLFWHLNHAHNIIKWNIHRWEFKRVWRVKFEYILEELGEWNCARGRNWIIAPEWLCRFSGHHTVDCCNHNIEKPEHDSCVWCDNVIPFTANLPQPIPYRMIHGKT